MGKIYTCLKKFYAPFNCLDIEQSIALTSKNYTSLDYPAHKEYNSLCLVTVEQTKQVTGTYLWCSKNEAFYCEFFVETDFVSSYADE